MKPINYSAVSILGVFTMLWGLWVTFEWDAFNFSTVYTFMEFLPEWLWGSIALCVGAIILFGGMTQKFNALRYGSFIGAVFWLSVLVLFCLGNIRSSVIPLTLGYSAYSAYVYLNIKVNKDSFTDS